jgi:hypothetical protein
VGGMDLKRETGLAEEFAATWRGGGEEEVHSASLG